MQTWLNVGDDPQVLEDEIALELQAVEEDLANLDVEDDDVLSEEEGGGGRPESCITSSITEAEVHSRFEEIRSYLYAKGRRGGEYSETQYLLSKAVHSFTHETQVKRRGKERGGGAGNYSRFMEGVEHFWRTTTAAVLQKYLWFLELACCDCVPVALACRAGV